MRGRYGKTAGIAGKSMAVLPDRTVRTETAHPASQMPFGDPRNQPPSQADGSEHQSRTLLITQSLDQNQKRGRFMLLVSGRSDREVGSASARGGGGAAVGRRWCRRSRLWTPTTATCRKAAEEVSGGIQSAARFLHCSFVRLQCLSTIYQIICRLFNTLLFREALPMHSVKGLDSFARNSVLNVS